MCITLEAVDITKLYRIFAYLVILTIEKNRDIKGNNKSKNIERLVGENYGNLQIWNCRLKKKFRR